MAFVLSALLWLLALLLGALALVLIAVLALPLRLEVAWKLDGQAPPQAALRPFGRFGPRLPLRRSKTERPQGKPARSKPRRTRRGASRKGRAFRFAKAILALLRDILARISLVSARLDARFGLGDPADTGALYGQLIPWSTAASGRQNVHIRLIPDFERQTLEGQADLVLSIIPGRLLAPLARFAWRAFGPAR